MKMHVKVSVNGLADRLLGKIPKKYGSWEVLSDDTGRMLTKDEVWKELREDRDLRKGDRLLLKRQHQKADDLKASNSRLSEE